MKELHLPKLKMSTVLNEADQALQIFGSYLKGWRDSDKKAEGYCAIGLLACASDSVINGGMVISENSFLRRKYDITDKQLDKTRQCPECKKLGKPYSTNVSSIIIHLNDTHEWTYKQIGAYLKKLKL